MENGQVIFPGDPTRYGFCQKCTEHNVDSKLKCLECLRRTKSAHSFSSQYFNDPVDATTVEFKTDWFRKYPFENDLVKKLSLARGIMSIDPAVRLKETNDYTGIVITKVLDDQLVYVVEAIQKRMSSDDLIKEVFRLKAIYNVGKVLLETASSQILFLDLFKAEMAKRQDYFTIQEVGNSTKETKAMRIRGMLPFYANGRILHKAGLEDLEDQLLQFPRNAHDDIIDALAQQVPFWKGVPMQQAPRNDSPAWSLNWWKQQTGNNDTRAQQLFGDLTKRG